MHMHALLSEEPSQQPRVIETAVLRFYRLQAHKAAVAPLQNRAHLPHLIDQPKRLTHLKGKGEGEGIGIDIGMGRGRGVD